jgi:hypothetical protein
VISGSVVEKYDYSDDVGYGSYEDCYEAGKMYIKDKSISPNSQDYNLKLKKQRFRRLIDTNAYTYAKTSEKQYPPVLLTLTYPEKFPDIKTSKNDFHLFLKRLNHHFPSHSYEMPPTPSAVGPSIMRSTQSITGLKYVAVPEFQKRGAPHFHTMFFNLPYIHFSDLTELWGNGSIDVKRVDGVRELGSYMVKNYLVKGFGSKNIKKKSYLSSKDLKKPVIIRDIDEVNSISGQLSSASVLREADYHSKYVGDIHSVVYKLSAPLDF